MSEISCPHCGCLFEHAPKHARSTPQLRRFHAMIRAAYHHWLETDQDFRPRNEDHLRYFLTVEANHFTVVKAVRFETVDPAKAYWVMKALLDNCEDNRMFLELDGDLLLQKRAESIAFDSMSQQEFNELNDAVAAVIEAKIGKPVDVLLRETEKAA